MLPPVHSLEEIEHVLTDLIADKIDIDRSSIQPESNLKALGLDSLDTFDLIFSAEDYFKIKVPSDEIKIETLEDVALLIQRLIATQK
ncbi:MAG: acyl carrier protein [Bacteroidia bacterium]|nr:acyl carrier protein [Methylotenera sp.]